MLLNPWTGLTTGKGTRWAPGGQGWPKPQTGVGCAMAGADARRRTKASLTLILSKRPCSPTVAFAQRSVKWNWAPERMPAGQRDVTVFSRV